MVYRSLSLVLSPLTSPVGVSYLLPSLVDDVLIDAPNLTANFLAFDVIGEYAFGVPFGFLASGSDGYNLINTVDTRGEVLNTIGHLPRWIRPYMRYFRIDPFFYNGLRSTANLEAIGRAAFGKRKAETSSAQRKDLMSFLLNAQDPDNGGPLPDEEVIAEAISFIVGGSDTTSSTMTNFMDFISRDQEIQSQIFAELLEAFPGPLGLGWVASEEVAGKLSLLNASIKEVMRLRPTSSTGLERVVPQGGRDVAGTFLPAGYLVSVPTVAIHHNHQIFSVSIRTFANHPGVSCNGDAACRNVESAQMARTGRIQPDGIFYSFFDGAKGLRREKVSQACTLVRSWNNS